MIEEIELVLFFRDQEKKNSDWETITNNFLQKRKYKKEELEQTKICEALIDNASNIAILKHGVSPRVFHDTLILNARRGKVIAIVNKNNKIIEFDKPEDFDE